MSEQIKAMWRVEETHFNPRNPNYGASTMSDR